MKKFLKFLLYLALAVILIVVIKDKIDTSMEEPSPSELPTQSNTETQAPAEEHFYLQSKNKGACKDLTGSVMITVVFTDEDESSWTEKDIADFKKDLWDSADVLLAEAERYGANLTLSFHYLSARITGESVDLQNHEERTAQALASMGFSDKEQFVSHLKETYSVKEAPVVFAVNRGGRAFARSYGFGSAMEYVILPRDKSAFSHELLHLFGAKDFYYPEEVKNYAELHLGDSIMLSSKDPVVDPLTAYVVGWTKLLPDAQQFLDATASITSEQISAAKKENQKTGYGTVKENGSTYTGYLLEGWAHGEGRREWDDGAVFEGTFEYGKHVLGTFTYPNGAVYNGPFKDGKRHGHGTFVDAKGTRYEGTFENGKFTGSGTATWSDGTTYVGEFYDWKPHGYGTLTSADGRVRSGQWENNKFIG